jgi:serine protease AprX
MMRVYPNPFKETMNANFHVIQDGYVTVEILDIMGKVVATPVAHEFFEDGYYTRMFNAGKLLPGVYTYRYLADDRVLKGKIVKE